MSVSQRGLCRVVRQELRDDDEPCQAQKKRDAKGDVRHRQALGQGTTRKGWDGTGMDRALAAAACISINSAQTLPPCIVPFGAIRLRGTSGPIGRSSVGVEMRRGAGIVL